MSKFFAFKLYCVMSIICMLIGAAVMRHYLNGAHAYERALADKACLKSVFLASQTTKTKRQTGPASPSLKVPRPFFVSSGYTVN